MPPHVDLVPRNRHDIGVAHYDIFAGEQLVGVIGQPVPFAQREVWSWALNTIMVDGSIGIPIKGYAHKLDGAKGDFRKAFDVWLGWAMAMPTWDLKRPHIDKNLKAMGVVETD